MRAPATCVADGTTSLTAFSSGWPGRVSRMSRGAGADVDGEYASAADVPRGPVVPPVVAAGAGLRGESR